MLPHVIEGSIKLFPFYPEVFKFAAILSIRASNQCFYLEDIYV